MAPAPTPLPGAEQFPLSLAPLLALGFEAHSILGKAAPGLWHPGLICRRALTLWESSSTGIHVCLTPQEGTSSKPYSGLTPRRPMTLWEDSSAQPRIDPPERH